MPEFTVTDRDLFIATVTAILVFIAMLLAVWGLLRRMRTEHPIQSLQVTGLPDRINLELRQLQQRVTHLESRLASLKNDEQESLGEDSFYGTAVKMLKQGFSADEVAARLGISKAEIDLLATLHQAETHIR